MDKEISNFKKDLEKCKETYEYVFEQDDVCAYLLDNIKGLKKTFEKYSRKKNTVDLFRLLLIIAGSLAGFALILMVATSNPKSLQDMVTNATSKGVAGFFAILAIVFWILYYKHKNMIYEYEKLIHDYFDKVRDNLNSGEYYNEPEDRARKGLELFKILYDEAIEELVVRHEKLDKDLTLLDNVVTSEYQTYDSVCKFLLIINNNRVDTIRDLINTYVTDMQHDEMVETINELDHDLCSAVGGAIREMSAKAEQLTNAINNQTATLASTIAASGKSGSGNVHAQCASCSKFSKCRNPYVNGCGAYVPR